MKVVLIFFALCCGASCFGQQLVYSPNNPNFGGETFNYQWLLSSANAQNSFTDPAAGREVLTDQERFAQDINRQLFSRLNRSILSNIIGDDLTEGNFTVGTLNLEIFESAEGLVVNILDTETGEQTQIIVPN